MRAVSFEARAFLRGFRPAVETLISPKTLMPSKVLLTILALFLLHPAVGSAQEVEFDIPTEIHIVPGRLSVTFQDSVQEETARQIVTERGYEVIEAAFEPHYVWASLKNGLSPEQIDRLENDPRVDSFSQSPLPDPILTTNNEAIERERPKFSLAIAFVSHVDREEAAALLDEVAGATITRTEKRPNELVIDVGDRDAEAFSALEGLESVKWVTYVGVPGNE